MAWCPDTVLSRMPGGASILNSLSFYPFFFLPRNIAPLYAYEIIILSIMTLFIVLMVAIVTVLWKCPGSWRGPSRTASSSSMPSRVLTQNMTPHLFPHLLHHSLSTLHPPKTWKMGHLSRSVYPESCLTGTYSIRSLHFSGI